MADKTTKDLAPAAAPEVARAQDALHAARETAADEMNELGPALRRSLDFPTKIRRNPVQTAGIAGGAAFLLLGGPRKAAKALERRLFPKRYNRPPTLLPKHVDQALDRLEPADRDQVRGHLEKDFAAYIKKEHPKEPADARRSIWSTYDLILGTVGTRAAREMVKRLFDPPPSDDERGSRRR